LEQLHKSLGKRRVVVARELTKQFETFHRGLLGETLTPPLREQGEMVIVVEGASSSTSSQEVQAGAMTLADHALALENTDLKPKAKAKALASEAGVSVAEAYSFLEHQKKEIPKSAVEKLRSQQRIKLARSKDARLDLRAALNDAVEAFLVAEGQTFSIDEHQEGAPKGSVALMKWLQGHPALPAPTELKEMATALLSALSAEEALSDALMISSEEN